MTSQQMEELQKKTRELRNDAIIETFNVINKDEGKIVPEHQIAYVEALLKARLIAPVSMTEPDDQPEKVKVQFSNLKNKDGDSYFMVFTDMDTLTKNIPDSENLQLLGITFDDLSQLLAAPGGRTKGFVINPFTENIITNKEQIDHIKKYILTKSVENGNTSVISEVYNIPHEISDRIESYFNSRGDVKKAYMFNMRTGDNLNRLIIVDIFDQSDYQAFAKDFNEKVLDDIKDEKIPYLIAPYSDEGAKRATIEKVPFYVKL